MAAAYYDPATGAAYPAQQQYYAPTTAAPMAATYGAPPLQAPQPQQPMVMVAEPPPPFRVVNPQYTAPAGGPMGQPTIIVVDGGGGAVVAGAPTYGYGYNDGYYACAALGLLMSWIPLVGWITFCAFAGAPRGSRTRRCAVGAGIIGTLFFIVYIIAGAASGAAAGNAG
jgi:hypothetical protein